MESGTLSAPRRRRAALRARIAKLAASARRLPRRLARVARIAMDLARAAASLELRAGLRRREDERLVRRSDLFEVRYYLAQCGGDPAARADPVRHYLTVGAALGLDPSPLFDGAEYVRRNPAAGRPGENPLAHHLRARAAWRPPLALPPGPARADAGRALLAAHPFRASPRERAPCAVLVLDGTAPAQCPAARAGRTVALVEALRGVGHEVTLFSAARAPLPGRHWLAAARAHLEAEGHGYGLVLLAGPDESAHLLAAVRAHAPSALLVYDAAGVHGARLARDAGAAGDPAARAEAERLRAVERVNAACADLVLAFTAHDRDALLAEVPGARVEVLAHEPVAPSATGARLEAILSASGLGAGSASSGSAA